jgi:acyl carrier protein
MVNLFESYGVSLSNIQATMNDVREKVINIIADQLDVSIERVIDSASFMDDLGADDLDFVELILEFERVFNISIPDDQAEQILTVGEAITYIQMRNIKL